jgi:predicted dehydrogenase
MRLAILGLKGHHKTVLSGAERLGDVQVVAVSDDMPENIEKFHRDCPLGKNADVYTDWRQLLEHAVFDYCCVGDENYLRDEQVIRLLERNVHVIAEKPLAVSLERLERIRTALGISKSRLTMLLTMRHDPPFVKMREIIRSGAIGEVCQASSQKSYQLHTRPDWFKHRDRLGGVIPFIGVHAIDLMLWTTGLDFTHVAAFQGRIGTPEILEPRTMPRYCCECRMGPRRRLG